MNRTDAAFRERHSNGPYTFRFESMPPLWPSYLRILLERKSNLLHEAQEVPRLDAILTHAKVDAAHLARYRAVCGITDSTALPIEYPHVLAMPLQLTLLTCRAFPVRIPGFVHVRTRIRQRRPLAMNTTGELHTWIEGHRETDHGQEFDLHTEWRVAGESVWSEICTYLARRRERVKRRDRTRASQSKAFEHEQPESARPTPIAVESGLGRRYAAVAGDYNPIHLSDISARAFGFDRAIIHGMWSLARSAAALRPETLRHACELNLQFKLPVRIPANVVLYTWDIAGGEAFTLRNCDSQRAHLSGALTIDAEH